MSLTVFFVLFCLLGTLSACLLYDMEDRQKSAPQPENKTESALNFPTTIDLSFDGARALSFPGITATLTTDVSGLRRIYFRPDNERMFFLALTYFPGEQLHGVYMFSADGTPLLMQERDAILQSEQSLSNWMAGHLLALKQQKLSNRRTMIDEL